MKPKLQFSVFLLSLLLILGSTKTSNAQTQKGDGPWDFEVTYVCADSAAVVALIS